MSAWATCTLVLCLASMGFTPASAISMKEALNLTANMTGPSSPVTRVVKLLEYLSEEIVKEGEYEEDLYEKFICWGKNLVKKTDANIDENIRIIEVLQMETQLMNQEEVSITDEKERNQKAVAKLRIEIMERKHERDVDKANFDAANEQMRQAILALQEAVAVLQATYDKYKDGVAASSFLAIKEDNSVYAKESEALSQAVTLAERVLDEGDALFVRRLFTGQVPVPKHNWNKLNKKADFAKSYKARSGRIIETFNKVIASITENKAKAVDKEAKDAEDWTTLDASLRDQLQVAQAALTSAKDERAAKLQRVLKLSIKITVINDELKVDADTIKRAEQDMEDKKKEWVVRKALRGEELKAIAKTIEILRSDDARDQFTKSYKSQGYTFLQERSSSLHTARVSKAADELARAAKESGDQQLARLAASVRSLQPGQPGALRRANPTAIFEPMMHQIDQIIADLKEEQKADVEKKEACERDREVNANAAITKARSIDDKGHEINLILARIAEYQKEADRQAKLIEEIGIEENEREKIRLAEKAAYDKDRADDVEAIEIVKSAKHTLDDFYVKNDLKAVDHTKPADVDLLQRSDYNPPKVWVNGEAGYGGRVDESNTLLFMMSQIMKDIKGDINLHDSDEKKAIQEYEEFQAEAARRKSNALEAQQAAKDSITEEQEKVVGFETARADELASMNAQVANMDELLPGCSYYTINFYMRKKNRNIEIDGLQKAKTFLQGGVFEDKNRALVVGDN